MKLKQPANQQALQSTLLNLMLLLMSTCLALGMAEAVVRFCFPTPNYGFIPRVLERNIFRYDETLGWAGIPLASNQYYSRDHVVKAHHDELGYRNRNKPYQADKENIIVLGDSYVWGAGVEDSETATDYLTSNNSHLNAYNIAAPGYGTDQELLALERFLREHPTASYAWIFLVYYCNDIEDVESSSRYGYSKPLFLLQDHHLQLTNTPVPTGHYPPEDHEKLNMFDDFHPYLSRSHLYNLLVLRALPFLLNSLINPASFTGSEVIVPRKNYALQLRLIEEIKRLAESRHSRFHAIFIITRNTSPQDKANMLELHEQVRQTGIDASVLISKKFPETDLWYDGHYSPRGQRMLAQQILDLM